MNISVTRDPQTGVTTILLDDEALDVLDSVFTDFEEDNSHLILRAGDDVRDAVNVIRQDVHAALLETPDL